MFDIPFLDVPALQSASGTVRLPGSKSISNRVLLLAALCEMGGETPTVLHDLLDSDDTRVMITALALLKEKSNETKKLFLGNAGTAMRPLTAALALRGGQAGGYELSGVPRMHERPIGDLVDALRQLGCAIDYLGTRPECDPTRIGYLGFSIDIGDILKDVTGTRRRTTTRRS